MLSYCQRGNRSLLYFGNSCRSWEAEVEKWNPEKENWEMNPSKTRDLCYTQKLLEKIFSENNWEKMSFHWRNSRVGSKTECFPSVKTCQKRRIEGRYYWSSSQMFSSSSWKDPWDLEDDSKRLLVKCLWSEANGKRWKRVIFRSNWWLFLYFWFWCLTFVLAVGH